MTQQHSSETWQESHLHIDLRAGLRAHSPPAAARNHPACAYCLISKASLRNTYATARVRGREGAERKVRTTTRLCYKKPAGHEQGTRNIVRDICNKTRQLLYCSNAIIGFSRLKMVDSIHLLVIFINVWGISGMAVGRPSPAQRHRWKCAKVNGAPNTKSLKTCHVRTDRMTGWLLNVSLLSSCFSSSLFLQSL